MRTLVCFMVTALLSNIQHVKTVRTNGPYNVEIKSIDQCEDSGTGEVTAGTKISSKGNGIKAFTGNVTFLVPWDQELQTDAEVLILRNGHYQPNFLRHNFKNCEQVLKVAKGTFLSMFAAAGYNFTSCPLPANNYFIQDWVLDVKGLDKTPSFIYGSYKIIVKWIRKKKLVGCFIIYDEIIPK